MVESPSWAPVSDATLATLRDLLVASKRYVFYLMQWEFLCPDDSHPHIPSSSAEDLYEAMLTGRWEEETPAWRESRPRELAFGALRDRALFRLPIEAYATRQRMALSDLAGDEELVVRSSRTRMMQNDRRRLVLEVARPRAFPANLLLVVNRDPHGFLGVRGLRVDPGTGQYHASPVFMDAPMIEGADRWDPPFPPEGEGLTEGTRLTVAEAKRRLPTLLSYIPTAGVSLPREVPETPESAYVLDVFQEDSAQGRAPENQALDRSRSWSAAVGQMAGWPFAARAKENRFFSPAYLTRHRLGSGVYVWLEESTWREIDGAPAGERWFGADTPFDVHHERVPLASFADDAPLTLARGPEDTWRVTTLRATAEAIEREGGASFHLVSHRLFATVREEATFPRASLLPDHPSDVEQVVTNAGVLAEGASTTVEMARAMGFSHVYLIGSVKDECRAETKEESEAMNRAWNDNERLAGGDRLPKDDVATAFVEAALAAHQIDLLAAILAEPDALGNRVTKAPSSGEMAALFWREILLPVDLPAAPHKMRWFESSMGVLYEPAVARVEHLSETQPKINVKAILDGVAQEQPKDSGRMVRVVPSPLSSSPGAEALFHATIAPRDIPPGPVFGRVYVGVIDEPAKGDRPFLLITIGMAAVIRDGRVIMPATALPFPFPKGPGSYLLSELTARGVTHAFVDRSAPAT